MRYGIALALAAAIIGSGWAFVWHTEQSLSQKYLEAGRGEQPQAGADPVRPEDQGIELTANEMRRAEIASFLASFAPLLIPATVLASLASAYRIGVRNEHQKNGGKA